MLPSCTIHLMPAWESEQNAHIEIGLSSVAARVERYHSINMHFIAYKLSMLELCNLCCGSLLSNLRILQPKQTRLVFTRQLISSSILHILPQAWTQRYSNVQFSYADFRLTSNRETTWEVGWGTTETRGQPCPIFISSNVICSAEESCSQAEIVMGINTDRLISTFIWAMMC